MESRARSVRAALIFFKSRWRMNSDLEKKLRLELSAVADGDLKRMLGRKRGVDEDRDWDWCPEHQ